MCSRCGSLFVFAWYFTVSRISRKWYGISMNQPHHLTKHITSNIQEQDCGWLKKPVLKEVQSHSFSFTTNASSKIFNKKQQDLIRGTRSLRAHAPKPNSSRKWGGAYSLEVQRLQKMAGQIPQWHRNSPPEFAHMDRPKFIGNMSAFKRSFAISWGWVFVWGRVQFITSNPQHPHWKSLHPTRNTLNITHVSKHRIPNYTLET